MIQIVFFSNGLYVKFYQSLSPNTLSVNSQTYKLYSKKLGDFSESYELHSVK